MSQAIQSWDIVKTWFPYTEKNQHKIRPAVVISSAKAHEDTEHYLLVMVTSARQSHWVDDVTVKHLQVAGLLVPCVIRMKLFTLESSLLQGVIGHLHIEDRIRVSHVLQQYIAVP